MISTTLLCSINICLAQYTAKPANVTEINSTPLRYTGLSLTWASANSVVACSGAVVFDPKIMLSASHCSFDEKASANPWRPAPEYFSRWHSSSLPTPGSGVMTRGYLYFSSYAGNVNSTGMNSWESFDDDITANFSYSTISDDVAPSSTNGTYRLLAKGTRLTAGYPSSLYKGNAPEKFLMHYSGPWDSDCRLAIGSAVYCDGVSAGPGNSGGPVFVWEPSLNSYIFAGVHVAGTVRKLGDPTDASGINALDAPEWSMIQTALLSTDPGGNSRIGQATPRSPRLQILGNNSPVISGATEVSRTNHTDFGSVTANREVRRTFSVTNSGDLSLTLKEYRPIRLTGQAARYFSLGRFTSRQVAPGELATFSITFKRSPRGSFLANVVIDSDDPGAPRYTFKIKARRR